MSILTDFFPDTPSRSLASPRTQATLDIERVFDRILISKMTHTMSSIKKCDLRDRSSCSRSEIVIKRTKGRAKSSDFAIDLSAHGHKFPSIARCSVNHERKLSER